MTTKKINNIAYQKKVSRSLKGIIVALVAIIGFFKISIGGIVNIPIAYLLGDVFVGFFIFLLLFAFYLIIGSLKVSRKRFLAVIFSLITLLILGSALYSAIIRNFSVTSAEFGANLNAMTAQVQANFPFGVDISRYWYNYGGILGEGIIYLLTPLGSGLILAFIIIFSLLALTLLCWPLLVRLFLYIKEEIRDLRKRRKVLREAVRLDDEVVKDAPTKVSLSDVLPETKAPEHPLLKQVVAPKENITPKIRPLPVTDIEPDPVTLPTLDIEETFEAIHPQMSENTFEKVPTDNFDSLQKAVEDEGSIEKINFADQTLVDKVEPMAFEKDEAEEEVAEETFLPPPPAPSPPPFAPVEMSDINDTTSAYHNAYPTFKLPDINLLKDAETGGKSEENRMIAAEFEQRLNAFFNDFDIGARVVNWTIGSTFTRFEIALEATESVSKITPRMTDISLRLNGSSVRFEPIIPGKNTSGIEVANTNRTIVGFKECMQEIIAKTKKKFVIPFGRDVAGSVISASFTDIQHLLVAGSTGSGKSVFIHTLLTSLIVQHTPSEMRILLIDPKRVELSQYANIPHLLTPIIKEPSEAKVALERLIVEMESRFRLFEGLGVNNIRDYNDVISDNEVKIPILVVVIDEFADLVESEKEVSGLVLRLIQKSRAAGFHLVVATQRPTVQVISGNIKANFTSRVAFMTASAIDSGTILGQGGAETLLGNGDMLLDCIATGHRGLLRVQSSYLPTKEVLQITNYLRTNYRANFHPDFIDLKEKVTYSSNGQIIAMDDQYKDVYEFVLENETISISRIQQQFAMGWPKARQYYDLLLHNGVIEKPDDPNSAKGAIVIQNKRR